MRVVNQAHSFSAVSQWGTTACACLLVAAQSSLANPTGGNVTAGNAKIVSQGTTTTITQTSSKAIINWNDFSINPNETTQFKQPSANSFTLNRVTGGNPSQIMGTLKANGNIYILNANGILFGKNARVNVGGLVASTSQMTDKDFLSGKTQQFTPGHAGASIINEGTITVRNAGLAVLVAPTVVNSGIIEANLGTVHIASADHFTLDLYGDNLISLDAGKQVSQGLIENKGTIRVNGGKVYITAQAADKMLENVVNMDGYIQATSVSTRNGKVVLQGYGNTQINVNGTINVSNTKHSAGTVQVTANKVTLGKKSVINASGYAGGGTVNIGGEYQGKGTLAHANDVVMNTGAMINADAIHSGKGGTVTLWSDENTDAHGSIFARGGAISGDGGFIETSSHLNLNTAGATISASAAHGRAGEWLLDPLIATINDVDAAGFNSTLAGGTSVTVWANDDIDFNNASTPISWNTTASFNARADFNQDGVGTINFTAGAQVNTTTGTVNFYYNPAVFGTPFDFVTPGDVNVSGSGVFNPYMLVNDDGAQLQAIGSNASTLGQYYALNEDLCTGLGTFTSLGGQGSGNDFTGHFTGAIYQNDSNTLTQYTVSNLTINAPGSSEVGLFGQTSNATLENVVLIDPTITGNTNVGSAIGYQGSGTVTSNILLQGGSITGSSNVGGLIGQVDGGVISGTIFEVDGGATADTLISGGDNTGGLVGRFSSGTLSTPSVSVNPNGSFNVFVSGNSYVGGLFGLFPDGSPAVITTTSFANNANTVADTVTGASRVGGLFGYYPLSNFIGSVFTFTNSANVHGTGIHVGGIFGETRLSTQIGDSSNLAILTNSGNISSDAVFNFFIDDAIGGIAGYVETNFFANMTNTGDVIAPLAGGVGGLIGQGYLGTYLAGSYSSTAGTVSGAYNTGGLIGNGADIQFGSQGNLDMTMTRASPTTLNVGNGGGGFIGSGGWYLPSIFHSITMSSNITISGTGNNGGFIGAGGGVTLPAGYINTINVTSTGDNVGGVVGWLPGQNVSSDATNNANISGVNYVGGIYGYVSNTSTVTGAYTQAGGTITGTGNSVGGIIGALTDSTVSGSNNFNSTGGSVSGVTNVGGLIGQVDGTSLFNRTGSTSISNAASVSGSGANIGGLFGLVTIGSFSPATSGTLTNTGTVTGTGSASKIGGIIGYYTYASPSVTNNYAMTNTSSGTVTGASGDYVGGIIGDLHYISVGDTLILNGALDNSATVSSAGSGVGGIYGLSDGVTFTATLSNSGAISSTGAQRVGGIGGDSTSNIFNNITINSSGNVNASNAVQVGGMFGRAYADQFDSATLNLTSTSVEGKSTSGGAFVGGLIGYEDNSGFWGLTNTAITVGNNLAVLGYGAVGGLIGWSTAAFSPVSLSVGSGLTVTGDNYIGGLIGGYDAQSPGFAFPVGGYTNTGTITATSDHVGGIIGMWYGADGVTPSNISQPLSNTGSVSGTQDVGGIFGNVQSGTLSGNFTNSGSVTGTDNVGGIIGLVQSFGLGTILDTSLVLSSTSGAIVTGTSNVGGLIGNIATGVTYQPTSTFTNGGEVTSTAAINSIGGIFGALPAGLTITNPLINNGYVHDNNATAIGGIMGVNAGNDFTQNLTNNGQIGGKDFTGGIFGQITGSNTFSANWLNTGSISGRHETGGVVGSTLTATFTGSLENQGNIPSAIGSFIGGIFGEFGGTITNTASLLTSKGIIVGFNQVGGLIGQVQSSAVINALSMSVTDAIGPVSVTADRYVGGLFGQLATLSGPVTSVNTMVNDATVFSDNTDDYAAGGIFAFSNGNIFNANMTNNGNINGLDAGGIAGNMYNTQLNGTLQNFGNITAGNAGGGIVGVARNNSIVNGTIIIGNGTTPITVGTHNTVTSVGYVIGSLTNGSDLASTSVTVNANVSFDLVQKADAVGGVVGTMDTGATLSGFNSNPGGYSIADPIIVTNTNAVGSVIGVLLNNTFSGNLNSLADVSGDSSVGGIIGSVSNSTLSGTLTGTHDVTGNTDTGGLIGHALNSNFTGINLFDATVTGVTNTGGIVGTLDGGSLVFAGLDGSSGHGTVIGNTNTGGIIGSIVNGGTLDQAYNTSNNTVVGVNSTGGIVGINNGTITNVGFGGTVIATGINTGGIVGTNNGTVQYALSVGPVTGLAGSTGALVGLNNSLGILANSFYDNNINTMGSVGSNLGAIFSVVGSNYSTLGSWSTYAANSFNPAIWQVLAGNYASLIWCGTSCITPLYVPPPVPPTPPTPTPSFSTNLFNIIQTQITNNEYSASMSVLYDVALWLASTGLNIIPGTTIIEQMNVAPTSPYYTQVMWYLTNSVVLQWLDDTTYNMTMDPETYTVTAIQEAVKAEQKAMGCPVNNH